LKSGRQRINQDREGMPVLDSASLPQGQNVFNPSVAMFTGCPETSFSPQNSEAKYSLCVVVCRLDACLQEKQPQVLHLKLQASDQSARWILPVPVDFDKTFQACDKGPPFTDGRRGFGHMAQPPEFVPRPGSAFGQGRILALCQPLGFPDQMRQTGLSLSHPLTVHAVAIGDQDARPSLDKLLEGGFGAPWVQYEQCGARTCHDPKPNQLALATPGSFIHMPYRRIPHDVGDALVMRLDRLTDTFNDLLDAALANGQAEDRQEEVLNGAATVPMFATNLSDNGRKAGAEAGSFLWRDQRLDHSAALGTAPSIKDDVLHIEPGLGDLNMLMGVVGFGVNQVGAATLARPRMHFRNSCGA